ncbi:hypothetical protein CPB86DRAFT_725472, partial [Serendipita vermifera]
RPRPLCQVCNSTEFKYTCATCRIVYCSVPCYKKHNETSCGVHNKKESRSTGIAQIGLEPDSASREWATETVNGRLEIDGAPLEAPAKLRPLTTLKWPAVPPPPALIDPLTVNDPKPLQLPHYEAIATSTQVREALQTNPKLPAILRALDKLEGDERVRALEAVLGVLS